MSWLEKLIEPWVRKTIESEVEKALPNIIESRLRKMFKESPNLQLTAVGWNWALALALTAKWPEVSKEEAIRWLSEYVAVPFGTKGYDWTPGAAEDIAREYVSQFGEITE